MTQGALSLVLHAHLPFVRHPEYESFHEESWLFEAITESYVPLLRMLDRLAADGIETPVTLSLSPTLLAMLGDAVLMGRYRQHLEKMRALAAAEVDRTRDDDAFAPLARMYAARLDAVKTILFERHGGDLVAGFAGHWRTGGLELITCAATHAYLPLMRFEPNAVEAQLKVGQHAFEAALGAPAAGVWLPECGYYPGLEHAVRDAGFDYFFVDSHGLLNARPQPRMGTFAPVRCTNGCAVFARDPESSHQVWSREDGYPGDRFYRDFYRDIGFDLDFDYVRPYILDGETRVFTGFKYHRITGAAPDKEPYDPAMARERVGIHAEHFVAERERAVASLAAAQPDDGAPLPLITAPYDAELFGHWWFEGPEWLEAVIRRTARSRTLALTTPSAYLAGGADRLERITPAASSWGEQGYNVFWLSPANDWIYPHLHQAARDMRRLLARSRDRRSGRLVGRALRQAARSLLLAQASDWAFVMKTGASADYALQRIRDHLARFHYLKQAVESGKVDERRLRALETMDAIFPDLDPEVFA